MDRQDWLLVSLWIHVPFITTWIGLVMLDSVAVFAPGLQDEQRARLLLWSRWFVILAVPVILATGIWQTMENPFFRVNSYSDLGELRERLYGDLLFWKHGFVLATFGLTVLVRFILAPRLEQSQALVGAGAMTGTPGADSTRMFQLTRVATAANLAACLGAVLLATRMVAELH